MVIVIERVADYFTSYLFPPVRHIAEASQTGAATNFLAGFSTGLQSTAPSAVVLVVAILVSYYLGYYGSGHDLLMGVYSTAIATMSMLSLTGVIMSIDSFGPITDNANGIAEMAGLEGNVREVTDELDADREHHQGDDEGLRGHVGGARRGLDLRGLPERGEQADQRCTTSSQSTASRRAGRSTFTLSDPHVIIGLFIGSLLPFYFSSFLIQAVGRAAIKMVNEVRRQFREIPGIMEGTGKPDYAKCVDISTPAAIKELAAPAILAVATPLVVGFVLGPLALGGLLIGSVISGVYLAFTMTNGGAAWDNAKKYIEIGNLRRQGHADPRRGGDGRHGRRPVQGHRGTGDQLADQGPEHDLDSLRLGDRALRALRLRLALQSDVRDPARGAPEDGLGFLLLQAHLGPAAGTIRRLPAGLPRSTSWSTALLFAMTSISTSMSSLANPVTTVVRVGLCVPRKPEYAWFMSLKWLPVLDVDGRLHDLVGRAPRCLEDGLDVLHDLLGLLDYASAHHLVGLGVDSDASGDEDEAVCDYPLRVRAYRLDGVRAFTNLMAAFPCRDYYPCLGPHSLLRVHNP